MGDHKHNLNYRPETGTVSKRPAMEATSHVGSETKQKTVRTSIDQSEIVIVSHQTEGWRIVQNIQQGGGEVLLIFER